ncbi:MAG: glycosyltransferase, partial [Sulfolobales archaeon]
RQEVEKNNAENFEILLNLHREKLRELLLDATFYVHPQFSEHFGISIVEAMSAGCVPIVFKKGGGWEDVVKPIDLRLGYNNISEIRNIISALNTGCLLENIRNHIVAHVQKFKSSNFRMKFLNIVRGVYYA